MKEEEWFEKFFNKALKFLSFRPRSEKELADYLAKKTKKYNKRQKLLPRIIEKLKKINLLDDKKFILWWLEQRSLLNPRGKRLLTAELRQKGVAQELIDEVFTHQALEKEEIAWAAKVVKKKLKLYRHLSPVKQKQKLIVHLQRRGFSWPVIKSILLVDEGLKVA